MRTRHAVVWLLLGYIIIDGSLPSSMWASSILVGKCMKCSSGSVTILLTMTNVISHYCLQLPGNAKIFTIGLRKMLKLNGDWFIQWIKQNSYLCRNMPLLQPPEIRVTPNARRPGRDVPQVIPEIEVFQAIVQKLPNVPRKVIMSVDERHFLEQPGRELETLLEGRSGADFECDRHPDARRCHQEQNGHYNPPMTAW